MRPWPSWCLDYFVFIYYWSQRNITAMWRKKLSKLFFIQIFADWEKHDLHGTFWPAVLGRVPASQNREAKLNDLHGGHVKEMVSKMARIKKHVYIYSTNILIKEIKKITWWQNNEKISKITCSNLRSLMVTEKMGTRWC